MRTSARVNGYNAPPVEQSGSASSEATVQGGEQMNCNTNGRRSGAAGKADIKVDELRSDGVGITLSTSTFANGGHYVVCNTCISGTCVGVNGHDTSAAASASATAIARIIFGETVRPIYYRLRVPISESGSGAPIEHKVLDGAGQAVAVDASGSYLLISRPGEAYTVELNMQASSTDTGACCDHKQASSAAARLLVSRAPILASALSAKSLPTGAGRETRRIVGGKETEGFPEVGALMLDGEMHCTGTLIGPRTVLTAGHCVYGLDSAEKTKHLTFREGFNAFDPLREVSVTSFAYPMGEGGFSYDDHTLADDIALVYLAGGLKRATPIGLHLGKPLLSRWVDTKRPVEFVGFGYDVIQGSKAGLGLKRHVTMPLNRFDDRRFWYGVAGKNTCNGDSGGPAYVSTLTGKKVLLLGGVTSAGDKGCLEYGIDTRVESYAVWLKGRIK